MLTVEQLKAIASGAMSVEDAMSEDKANGGKKRKFGCCDGPVAKRGPAQGESKLDTAIRELNSRRSTMSAEDVAKAEKRIVRLYVRWSENNGGKKRKSADGRIGYVAESDKALTRLEGGYRPHGHSIGKRPVRVAKGVWLELPGFGDSDGSPRGPYRAPRRALHCFESGAHPGAYDHTCKALRIMQGD